MVRVVETPSEIRDHIGADNQGWKLPIGIYQGRYEPEIGRRKSPKKRGLKEVASSLLPSEKLTPICLGVEI